jgi:Skp family chaperone for outer membrane proteins
MKASLFLLAAAFLPGIFLMQANGGPTVVVIDFDRALSEAPGGKDAITKITTFQNEQLAAMTAKQKEAEDLETRLRVQDRVLTAETRTQLTRNLETTRTSIQAMGEEAQKKLGEMRQQLIVPIEQKTAMAVSAYALEHGVKIVLDASALQSGLVYVHDTADITTEIIRRIASDLQNPNQRNASLPSDRILNRNWMDLNFGN